mmetsp:Transcript_36402/g.91938  ORF Transcript_36402/g.91938 Transcript_36402/m.91938 type:complete len:359 (+) Transcript_36402:1276-2352(+)
MAPHEPISTPRLPAHAFKFPELSLQPAAATFALLLPPPCGLIRAFCAQLPLRTVRLQAGCQQYSLLRGSRPCLRSLLAGRRSPLANLVLFSSSIQLASHPAFPPFVLSSKAVQSCQASPAPSAGPNLAPTSYPACKRLAAAAPGRCRLPAKAIVSPATQQPMGAEQPGATHTSHHVGGGAARPQVAAPASSQLQAAHGQGQVRQVGADHPRGRRRAAAEVPADRQAHRALQAHLAGQHVVDDGARVAAAGVRAVGRHVAVLQDVQPQLLGKRGPVQAVGCGRLRLRHSPRCLQNEGGEQQARKLHDVLHLQIMVAAVLLPRCFLPGGCPLRAVIGRAVQGGEHLCGAHGWPALSGLKH